MTVREAESIDTDLRTLDALMSTPIADAPRFAWRRLRKIVEAASEAARQTRGDEVTKEVPLPGSHRLTPGAKP